MKKKKIIIFLISVLAVIAMLALMFVIRSCTGFEFPDEDEHHKNGKIMVEISYPQERRFLSL